MGNKVKVNRCIMVKVEAKCCCWTVKIKGLGRYKLLARASDSVRLVRVS